MPEIKAYCLDFNWQGSGRRKKIADPPFMKDADPQAVVDWHILVVPTLVPAEAGNLHALALVARKEPLDVSGHLADEVENPVVEIAEILGRQRLGLPGPSETRPQRLAVQRRG